MMFINIIHSAEPQTLYDNLKELSEGEKKITESGIEVLKRLKERRENSGN